MNDLTVGLLLGCFAGVALRELVDALAAGLARRAMPPARRERPASTPEWRR